jgi:UDPglucose 6-dehydrogenase
MYSAQIGIIGLGYVGNAIKEILEGGMNRLVIIDPLKGYADTYQDLEDVEAVFICVPTPTTDDGQCDSSILEEVLANLAAVDFEGVIISKSTASPKVYEALNTKYKNLIHVPEFLTSANAYADLANTTFAIIGGKVPAYRREAERFIALIHPGLKDIRYTSIGEAALAKYVINSFLATKVVFMNEVSKLAESMGYNYDEVLRMFILDERIGKSHTRVPGPDRIYGFGGHCFPKDTAALLQMSKEFGATMQVLEAAIKKNTLLRISGPLTDDSK